MEFPPDIEYFMNNLCRIYIQSRSNIFWWLLFPNSVSYALENYLSQKSDENKTYALIEVLKNIAKLWRISLLMHRDLLRFFSYTMTVRGIRFLIEHFEDNQPLNEVCVKFIKHPYPHLCLDAMNTLNKSNALTLHNLSIVFTKEHPEIFASIFILLSENGLYEKYHQSFIFDKNAATELSILHILSDSHLINEQNIILFIENRKKLPLLTDTFRLFYKYGLLNSNDANQLYSILIQYSNEYYVACAVYGLRFFIFNNLPNLKEIFFNTLNYHDGAELLKIINNLKHSKTLTPEKYLKLIHHENALELSETILNLVNCGLYDEDLFEHLIQEAQPKLIACILNLLIKQNLYRPNYFFLILKNKDKNQLHQLFELVIQYKHLKNTEIKKLIPKIIQNPQPYALKQILLMVFEQPMIEKKHFPKLLRKLLKTPYLDSLLNLFELFFQNSSLLTNEQSEENIFSMIGNPNIKQLSDAFLQIRIQDVFKCQQAQYYFDLLIQHNQPEILMVILQSLNIINRLDDLELFQQISSLKHPTEYARTLVCLHQNGLISCATEFELVQYHNGYGFDILLRFLSTTKIFTKEFVFAFAKYQNILLNHQLIFLWDEVGAGSISESDIYSIIKICNQEVNEQEKIKGIWQIFSLSIPTLRKIHFPWDMLPINNVHRSSSITFLTLKKQYQSILEESSIYELMSNFKYHIDLYATDGIEGNIAHQQLVDIYLNYSNYYDSYTSMTPIHIIGLISLALKDCYDLKGCVKDLIQNLNHIHTELQEPQIKILAFFDKLALCLNDHHPRYKQIYSNRKFSNPRAHTIIEREVASFCEQHHIGDFQMKTYWPQLKTSIEESFADEFFHLYSKAQIKHLALRFDHQFSRLSSKSFFAESKALSDVHFVIQPLQSSSNTQ